MLTSKIEKLENDRDRTDQLETSLRLLERKMNDMAMANEELSKTVEWLKSGGGGQPKGGDDVEPLSEKVSTLEASLDNLDKTVLEMGIKVDKGLSAAANAAGKAASAADKATAAAEEALAKAASGGNGADGDEPLVGPGMLGRRDSLKDAGDETVEQVRAYTQAPHVGPSASPRRNARRAVGSPTKLRLHTPPHTTTQTLSRSS